MRIFTEFSVSIDSETPFIHQPKTYLIKASIVYRYFFLSFAFVQLSCAHTISIEFDVVSCVISGGYRASGMLGVRECVRLVAWRQTGRWRRRVYRPTPSSIFTQQLRIINFYLTIFNASQSGTRFRDRIH